MDTTPRSDTSLGSAVAARWSGLGRREGSAATCRVATGSQMFAASVGRSMATRVVLRRGIGFSLTSGRSSRPTIEPGAGSATPVEPPLPAPITAVMRAWNRAGETASGEEQPGSQAWPPPALSRALPTLKDRMPPRSTTRRSAGVQRSAAAAVTAAELAVAPRGLPRVTTRGNRTPAGEMTTPSSGLNRIAPRHLPVQEPDEVAAVGPTLTRRDMGRAPRHSTPGRSVGESSPSGPPAGGTADTRSRPGPVARTFALPGSLVRRRSALDLPGRRPMSLRPSGTALVSRRAEVTPLRRAGAALPAGSSSPTPTAVAGVPQGVLVPGPVGLAGPFGTARVAGEDGGQSPMPGRSVLRRSPAAPEPSSRSRSGPGAGSAGVPPRSSQAPLTPAGVAPPPSGAMPSARSSAPSAAPVGAATVRRSPLAAAALSHPGDIGTIEGVSAAGSDRAVVTSAQGVPMVSRRALPTPRAIAARAQRSAGHMFAAHGAAAPSVPIEGVSAAGSDRAVVTSARGVPMVSRRALPTPRAVAARAQRSAGHMFPSPGAAVPSVPVAVLAGLDVRLPAAINRTGDTSPASAPAAPAPGAPAVSTAARAASGTSAAARAASGASSGARAASGASGRSGAAAGTAQRSPAASSPAGPSSAAVARFASLLAPSGRTAPVVRRAIEGSPSVALRSPSVGSAPASVSASLLSDLQVRLPVGISRRHHSSTAAPGGTAAAAGATPSMAGSPGGHPAGGFTTSAGVARSILRRKSGTDRIGSTGRSGAGGVNPRVGVPDGAMSGLQVRLPMGLTRLYDSVEPATAALASSSGRPGGHASGSVQRASAGTRPAVTTRPAPAGSGPASTGRRPSGSPAQASVQRRAETTGRRNGGFQGDAPYPSADRRPAGWPGARVSRRFDAPRSHPSAAPVGRFALPARGPDRAGRSAGSSPNGPVRLPGAVARRAVWGPGAPIGTAVQRRVEGERSLPVQLRPLGELMVSPAGATKALRRSDTASPVGAGSASASAASAVTVAPVAPAVLPVQRRSAGPGMGDGPVGPAPVSAPSAEVVLHDLVRSVASRASATGAARRVARAPEDGSDDDSTADKRRHRVSALIRAFEARSDATAHPGSSQYAFGATGLSVGPGASPLTVGAVGQLLSARGGSPAVDPDADSASPHRPRRNPGRHRPGQPGVGSGGPGPGSGGPSGIPAEYLAQLPPAVARLVTGPTSGRGADQLGPDAPPAESNGPVRPFGDPVPLGATPNRPHPFLGGAMPASGFFSSGANPPLVDSSSSPISTEVLDWIVDAVEERILEELERRGMRFQPGVF